MSPATPIDEEVQAVDPTLAALVPQRSFRRRALLTFTAVALLAGAVFLPRVLQPSLARQDQGSWSVIGTHRQVLAMVQVRGDGWPRVNVHAVRDVPGAHVAGAWLSDDIGEIPAIRPLPDDFATSLDYMRAAIPAVDFGPRTQLPRNLDDGAVKRLWVLWDITDCSKLIVDQEPEIQLGTVLGTTHRVRLNSVAGPAFDISTLIDSGVCPKR